MDTDKPIENQVFATVRLDLSTKLALIASLIFDPTQPLSETVRQAELLHNLCDQTAKRMKNGAPRAQAVGR